MKVFNMKKFIYYLFILLLVFLFACDEESTPTETGTNPNIEEIIMRSKWNSASSILSKVEVKVTDPQGFSDIDGVFIEIKNQSNNQVVFTDSLYDDGANYFPQDGDVIAGDGIYSNQFSSMQILSGAGDGDYIFSFQAFDKENHVSSLAEQTALFGPNAQPEIVAVVSPLTLFSGTSGQIFEVSVSDDDGIDDIIRVYFESQEFGSQTQIYEMDFFNTGNFEEHGDLFADDSIYTIRLDSTFAAGKQGPFIFHYYVEDSFNELNQADVTSNIEIENLVGTILATSVPDSIAKPLTPGNTVPFELNAVVTDPQGLTDIDSVYFLSEKPDGTFAGNGFRFQLLDDGNQSQSGDDIANDGEYSIVIEIASSNDPGIYIFHFYMRDQVRQLTNVVQDSIVVY